MVKTKNFLSKRKAGGWQTSIYVSDEQAQQVIDALTTIVRDYAIRHGAALGKSEAVVEAILGYAQIIKAQSQEDSTIKKP